MSIAAMRSEVHGVDVHVGADRVRGLDDRCQIRGRAEQVRRTGNGDPPGAFVDELDHVLRWQLPGRRVERRQHVNGAGRFGSAPPRRDVGIVVEPGTDDPITGAQGRADRPRHGEGQRCHVGTEADAIRVGPEQLADARPCSVHQPLALLGRGERSAVGGGVAAGHPLAHRGDGRVDHLRAGRSVEARPVGAMPGKRWRSEPVIRDPERVSPATGVARNSDGVDGRKHWISPAGQVAWLLWPTAWRRARSARCCADRDRRPRFR